MDDKPTFLQLLEGGEQMERYEPQFRLEFEQMDRHMAEIGSSQRHDWLCEYYNMWYGVACQNRLHGWKNPWRGENQSQTSSF